jgi:Anti-sigma factor NepR
LSDKEEKNIRHPADRRRRSKRTSDHDVGDALRSAYDRTLKEDIPPEMLDLLGKLG